MGDLKTHVKGAQTFLDKSDGRDKLLAAVQYAAMFVAAGSPGDAKRIQASVAAARKVFRVMRPLEALTPLLHSPSFNPARPVWVELLNKIKPVLMSVYFGGDHVVWASQAGLLANKNVARRAQKASLFGWFGGSLCTLAVELYELQGLVARHKGESDAEYAARQSKLRPEVRRCTIVLAHAAVQAALAMGLLELRPWKPRTVGTLGMLASLINCYMLYPAMPRTLFGSAAVPVPAVPSHAKAT